MRLLGLKPLEQARAMAARALATRGLASLRSRSPGEWALGFAVLILSGALAAAMGLSFPLSFWGRAIPVVADLSLVREARAVAAQDLGPAQLAEAVRHNEAARAQAPALASTWTRAAYLEARRAGVLTPEATQALEVSYAVAPLGPHASLWRLRFIYDFWPAVPASLRCRANHELRVLARHQDQKLDFKEQIVSPSGRLTAGLVINLARGDAQRDWAAKQEGRTPLPTPYTCGELSQPLIAM